MPACGVCTSPKRAEMEIPGRRALLGELSWRQAALLAGANNPKSLQNHMQSHYTAAPQKQDVVERNNQIKDEAVEMLLRRAEATSDPDEKLRLHLKVKEALSPNARIDGILRIMKEERELDTQKGIASALTMFGRQMFAVATKPLLELEAEVIDVGPDKESSVAEPA